MFGKWKFELRPVNELSLLSIELEDQWINFIDREPYEPEIMHHQVSYPLWVVTRMAGFTWFVYGSDKQFID